MGNDVVPCSWQTGGPIRLASDSHVAADLSVASFTACRSRADLHDETACELGAADSARRGAGMVPPMSPSFSERLVPTPVRFTDDVKLVCPGFRGAGLLDSGVVVL